MTDSGPVKRNLPSHFHQMLIVSKYEMLKYLRSWRLVGNIGVIALIVGLIYVLPLALNHPYTGHVTETLDIKPFGTFASIADLKHADVVNSSIAIEVNGKALPRNMHWLYNETLNSVVFFVNAAAYNGTQVVASFDFKTSGKDFASTFMQFTVTMVVITVTFFAADSLVSEYQNRTAYLLFPNPVGRATLYLGKYLASFLASLMMVALYYLMIGVLSLLTIGGVATYLPLSFAFAVLFMVGCISVAYFISSIMKGSTGAIVFTFFLLVMFLPIATSIGSISGMKMWFILTFTGDMTSTSLSWDSYPKDSVSEVFRGFTLNTYYPDPLTSTLVIIGYIVAFALISMAIFKRKQLLG